MTFAIHDIEALAQMVGANQQEDADIADNYQKGSVLNPGNFGGGQNKQEIAKPNAKIEIKVGQSKEDIKKLQEEKKKAQEEKKSKMTSDIWSEQEINKRQELPDDRPQPQFDVLYKQSVGTEDVYLGLSDMDPSSTHCQGLVVKIKLPHAKLSQIGLDVKEQSIHSPDYVLNHILPYPVQKDKGKAKFDSDKCELSVSVRLFPILLNHKDFFSLERVGQECVEDLGRPNALSSFQQNHGSLRYFSKKSKPQQEKVIDIESNTEKQTTEPTPNQPEILNSKQLNFKAETSKLLDIVAKSVYTNKQIFLRELLSNSSDACEKQRFSQLSGASDMSEQPLRIQIKTNEKQRTLTIFDTGIGMTKQELIKNLGTIAKSGTQQFLKQMSKNKQTDVANTDSIIGQFGIGFYSSFIVADTVEVISKHSSSPQAHSWVSDGSGEFSVGDVENCTFDRGTIIKLKLREDCRQFSRPRQLKNIITKYSLFIPVPIQVNGEHINELPAIWYRREKEVTNDQYDQFFEKLTNQKIPFRYKFHSTIETPFQMKVLLFIPSSHPEKFGYQPEPSNINLYSRKVLIKEKAKQLLPSYLRFVKGVVDCQDLPLNISRETYQDHPKVHQIKTILTKRVLRVLIKSMETDIEKYSKWFSDFQNFLKEGIATDMQNRQLLLKLMRYDGNWTDKSISIDDYIKKMKSTQKKIYYLVIPQGQNRQNNVYYQPFRGSDFPLLILNNHIDQMCFSQVSSYKQKPLVNVETNFSQIQNELAPKSSQINIPDEDITNFCLFMKHSIGEQVGKVTISKRLRSSPAVIVGQQSSSQRHIQTMTQQMGDQMGMMNQQMNSQNTMEINPNHKLVTGINELRKIDPEQAKELTLMMFENAMLNSGFNFDINVSAKRVQDIAIKLIEMKTQEKSGLKIQEETKSKKGPVLKQVKKEIDIEKEEPLEVVINDKGDPQMKK